MHMHCTRLDTVDGQPTRLHVEHMITHVEAWFSVCLPACDSDLFCLDVFSEVGFGKDSMIVFENPLGKCGAYSSSCHTFLDEIGDALKATPKVLALTGE